MRQHSFPDARSLHGLTVPPGRDVAFWYVCDMPSDTTNVCSSGWTGSNRPTAKTALLTRSRREFSPVIYWERLSAK
jgi:hypothetical protein